MTIGTAEAKWNGNLTQASAQMRLWRGACEGPYDFRPRMGDGKGTNPEELLGAVPTGCFSMALALGLIKAAFSVQRIDTRVMGHFKGRDRDWFHLQGRSRSGSMGPGSRDGRLRRVRAGRQE